MSRVSANAPTSESLEQTVMDALSDTPHQAEMLFTDEEDPANVSAELRFFGNVDERDIEHEAEIQGFDLPEDYVSSLVGRIESKCKAQYKMDCSVEIDVPAKMIQVSLRKASVVKAESQKVSVKRVQTPKNTREKTIAAAQYALYSRDGIMAFMRMVRKLKPGAPPEPDPMESSAVLDDYEEKWVQYRLPDGTYSKEFTDAHEAWSMEGPSFWEDDHGEREYSAAGSSGAGDNVAAVKAAMRRGASSPDFPEDSDIAELFDMTFTPSPGERGFRSELAKAIGYDSEQEMFMDNPGMDEELRQFVVEGMGPSSSWAKAYQAYVSDRKSE